MYVSGNTKLSLDQYLGSGVYFANCGFDLVWNISRINIIISPSWMWHSIALPVIQHALNIGIEQV